MIARRMLTKTLSVLLSALLACSLLPAMAFADGSGEADSLALTSSVQEEANATDFYKMVFLDCGRKYFSVSSIKAIIDNAAAAGMTHVQLAVGNDGLRFLLDDMSLSVGGKTYSSDTVKAGIQSGNENYYDFTTNELTEAEMDAIIAYATSKGIGIIPCINTPGHMDAIVDCMEYCGLSGVSYYNSARTVDVTNSTAVAFTEALLAKYVSYFASKGCKLFNMGADEYANDIYTTGSMGFGQLISRGQYGSYVTYVNEIAAIIKDAGMTPMAFNDGIYFNNTTSYGSFDTDIVICYWSSGWSGYTPMSASSLQSMGFKLVNTHGDYYWVLGKSNWQCSASKAAQFDINSFQGSTISDPNGAMLCIWCDYPGAGTEASVVSSTADVIAAFGTALPETTKEEEPQEAANTTSGNPFPQGTAGSNSFRIPSLVTLSDGTLVAAADARWNTTYDGGGLDTLTSYSTDGGTTWTWSFANYLGDNGNSYNGSSSTAFIDPAMAVTADDTIYLLCDLYPYGVALNGSGNTAPSTKVAFDSNGNLLLSDNGGSSFGYYLNLADLCIYSSSGVKQSGYTVDSHFNISGDGVSSNLFYADSPFTVVRTGYLYLVSSTDGGKSWSAPTLINAKTSAEMACLVAPGGSIVTESGRIVFPVYSYNGSSESQRVSFLYSDDGVTWQRSDTLDYNWGSESECVELDNGTLRFFFRNGSGYVCYADATPAGNGYSWGDAVQTTLAVNSNTQLSALKYSQLVDGKTAILLSCPTDSSSRKNGKVFTGLVEADGSMTWAYSMAVPSDNGSDVFQYSCLAETADGSIALLYEDYSIGWGAGSNCYCTMDFDTYAIGDIAPGAVIGASLVERAELNFNSGWKFCLGNLSADARDYDDSSWASVTLPHDFSISQSFTTAGEAESGFLPGGTGWYRKSFTLDSSYAGKSIILSFDGVYSDAYVYVNGSYVGENHYGYSNFAFDLSDLLVCDGKTENVVAVKAVNNIPTSRWYSGSGIYRDVTLIVANEVHANLNGVAVTTPDIASGTGTVNVATEIVNDGSAAATVKLTTEITRKGSSEVLATAETEASVPVGETITASCAPVVESPALWSPESPNLYTATVTLTMNGEVVDSTAENFGFRWYSFESADGFYLNGQAVKLNGVCLHHDQGGLGAAAYDDAIYRQLVKMKDMGANAIRVTHNPADEDLIAMCDSLGLMVIEELFDGWTVAKNGNSNDFSRYFSTEISSSNGLYGAQSGETWAEYVTKSIVRRDRNSASVILWSLGNEIQEGASVDSGFPTVAQNLINWIKAEDTTRPATIGDNTKSTSAGSVLGQVLQVVQENGGVVGFNYADSATLSTLHSAWGAIYSSETSSATNSRGIYSSQANNTGVDGKYHLTSYDTSAVGWGMSAHDSLYNTYTADYIAGEFVWTGFDYIGEPTPYNKTSSGSQTGSGAVPNSSYFGLVDTAGFEKDTYYLYRSQWNKAANTLHLVTAWDSNNMLLSSGKTPVVVYSNAATIKLYRDGALIGTAVRNAHTSSAGHTYYTYSVTSENSSVCTAVSASGSESLYATFNVAFAEGTISAKAFDENGNDITASCGGTTSVTTPGSAAKLSLSLDNADIYNGGLAYVAVDVLDANGNPVSTASNQISITVTGGSILAVDNGDQATTAKYQQSSVLTDSQHAQIAAYAGKALVVVTGGATVTVSADGLQGASYTVGGGAAEDPEDPEEPEEPEPAGLVDSNGSVVSSLSRCMDMGKSGTVSFSGKTEGSVLRAVSSNATVVAASVSDGVIQLESLLDGTAEITVTEETANETLGTYAIDVTVNKNYGAVKDISLTVGESAELTDESGDYSAAVDRSMLNSSVAAVTVTGKTTPATPATAASTSKLSSFATGSYVIGYESGSTKVYLVRNGSSLSTTTNPEAATVWTLSGTSSSAKLKSGSYYLRHSSSSLSLSTSSSNASWTFSSGRFSYTSSSRSWFSSSRTTYYLSYSNGFTVKSSSSYSAAAYTVTPGTAEIPGEAYTTIAVEALGGGTTGFILNDTLYRVTVARKGQTITVKSVDDAGKTLAADYTLTGTAGEAFTITPKAISNYDTPESVEGEFTEAEDYAVTLVYVLNTDKSALEEALDGAITDQGDYTDDSYGAYAEAVAAGQSVFANARALQSEVDAAVSAIATAKAGLKEKVYYGYVVVKYVDDAGATLRADESLSGVYGMAYQVTPPVIASYATPSAVSGTYGKETTQTITLVYVLSTDKSALEEALDGAITEQGDYTDDSYKAYADAVAAGQSVFANARALQSEVDAAVTAIATAKAGLKERVYYGYVIVKYVDDAGATLRADESLSGVYGTAYQVTPPAIASYATPSAVSGTYGKETTQTITLVYVLSTDKSALEEALDGAITEQGDYTDDSYKAYADAVAAGQSVFANARALQSEVDAAVSAIATAKAGLTVKRSGYTLDSNGIDSGSEYIIVRSGYALKCSGTSLTRQSVSVSNNQIADIDDSCVWIVTKSGSGYTLKNKSTGYYLSYSSSRSWFSTSYTLKASSSATVWTASVSGSTVKFKTSSRYLVYSSGFSLSSRSSSAGMSLYKAD